jgi:hypothetical protein
MSSDTLSDAELEKLAYTTRFLKTRYLRKVDIVENHLNNIVLDFKDVDLESEWRLQEIQNKKVTLGIVVWYRLLADLMFNILLTSGNFKINMVRFVVDIITLTTWSLIYYSPKSRKFKQTKNEFEEKSSKFS